MDYHSLPEHLNLPYHNSFLQDFESPLYFQRKFSHFVKPCIIVIFLDFIADAADEEFSI